MSVMAMALMLTMTTVVPTTTWAVSNPELEKALKVCSKQYSGCQSDCKKSAKTPPDELSCLDTKCKKSYDECRAKAEGK
jgi:hypothetical protein